MNFKKLQEKCSFSIEKVNNKQFLIKTNERIIEFKYENTIKDLFLSFQENEFNYDFIFNDKKFSIIRNEEIKAKKGEIQFVHEQKLDDKIIVPDNLPTSIKKEDNTNYYLPSWRNNLARRINSKINIFISGPAGCLDKDTMIDLYVPEEVFLKILDKRSIN